MDDQTLDSPIKSEKEQIAEFNKAKRASPSAFSNRPCLNQNEFTYRIFCVEKPAIDAMIKKGYPIAEIMYYWSESTGEAHAFPVFYTDAIKDVVNRYCDLFPREVAEFASSLAEYNKVLDNSKGFGKTGDIMHKMSMPLGLYRALMTLDQDFWHDKKNERTVMRLIPKLTKVGRPK